MAEPRKPRTPSTPLSRQAAPAPAGKRSALTTAQEQLLAKVGGASVDFAASSVISAIQRTATEVRNHLERSALQADDLSNSAYAALFTLWVLGDQEARHLAHECGVSKGTLTGIVTTLETRGLARRSAHPGDGRLVVVALTAKGRATAKRLYPKFHREEVAMVSALTAAEQRTLATLLNKITQGITPS